ncbi:GTPase Era [Flavobacteriales bacterium]|nr:GTPase Era [Flavobacteriales bacterium]
MFKSGFVNIIGYPNAGKSTLINSLLNDKLSIITEKAQTTRHKIIGIENTDNYQLIFTDNPGFTKPANIIHEYMNKKVKESIIDGDIILYVVDLSSKSIEYVDLNEKLKKIKVPLIIVLNKIDKVDQQILENISSKWKIEFNNAEIWTTSALNKFNVENLKERIIELLPEGPKYFPDDQWTDKSERFFVNEIIREKIFKYYKEEIPYSSEVVTEKFKYRNKVFRISSSIIVERNSQKAIIIGNKGSSLKKVASQSRTDLEKFFNKKVFLEINVKVVKDWRKKSQQLKNFGYN